MANSTNDNILLIFQKIIEQESKTSTYKFALLRAVIDLISAQSPHIEDRDTHVAIPVLLISDKWLFYYWDLIENGYAQIHSGRSLIFEERLGELQRKHKLQNYWDFNREFHKAEYLDHLKPELITLAKGLNDTIIKNPVKYIGTSMGQGYNALFQVESAKVMRSTSISGYIDLLAYSPKLLLAKSYYEGLKRYGGLLSGTNSIIINWVDFMEKQKQRPATDNHQLSKIASDSSVLYGKKTPLDLLLQSEAVERQTLIIRNYWLQKIKKGQPVFCTWSGSQIKSEKELAIDHSIPFSVLFNNDYWNLVPAKNTVNSSKSDKILSKTQLLTSKERVFEVWDTYQNTSELATIFSSQCQISLVKEAEVSLENLFEKFVQINEGFVKLRGMESWGYSFVK
jgi:hypothetical protein